MGQDLYVTLLARFGSSTLYQTHSAPLCFGPTSARTRQRTHPRLPSFLLAPLLSALFPAQSAYASAPPASELPFTVHNEQRSATIDYIFFRPSGLTALSAIRTIHVRDGEMPLPTTGLPPLPDLNLVQGSDHILLQASLEIVSASG